MKPNSGNLRFMHINKTAGTSVRWWFTKHMNLALRPSKNWDTHSAHVILENFSDPTFFYFTIVRNPYDRFASHFFQWKKLGYWKRDLFDNHLSNFDMVNEYINLLSFMDMENMIESVHFRHVQIEFVKPCSYWIKDWDRFKIFKTEELDKLVKFFEDNWDEPVYTGKNKETLLPKPWPKVGRAHDTVTKQLPSYKHLYNNKSLKIIQEICHDDFENFGYER